MNKGKTENSVNTTKNQEFELITSCHFKNLSKTHTEQSVESNFFTKFKAIASLPMHISPTFQTFYKKKDFPENPVNLGILVIITSTVQVELSKLNFNFDDIRTYFLQVLRNCQQITFVTLNGFCLLSKKISFCHNAFCLFLMDNIKMNRILTNIIYIVFQFLKVLGAVVIRGLLTSNFRQA